jgi:cytochrome P450
MKDPVLIKEVLQRAEDKLPLTGKAFQLVFGRSTLFASAFDKVQRRRESLATELDGKLLQRANKLPTKVVDCIMERVNGIVEKGSNCKEVSQHMAFSILGATLFGDAFLAWSNAAVYEELLMMIAKDACFWASYGVTPFWKKGFWRYQHLCTKLKCLTQDIIQQCKKTCGLFDHEDPSSNNDTTNVDMERSACGPSCSWTLMPYNFFSEINSHTSSRDELCGNMMGVMFHGCSTTAGLIASILIRLANNQKIQDKIYSEIRTQKGSSKQDEHNVDKMVLLLATIYESARLLPAGPLLQRCSLKHDLKLKSGVTIPAGAVVVVPLQLVQTDNSSWGNDAREFNPYRFLMNPENCSNLVEGAAEELVNQKQRLFVLNNPNENGAFLPFGSGARACVGQKSAIQGVATLFASLLERYEVRLQPSSDNIKPTTNDYAFQLNQSPRVVFIKR